MKTLKVFSVALGVIVNIFLTLVAMTKRCVTYRGYKFIKKDGEWIGKWNKSLTIIDKDLSNLKREFDKLIREQHHAMLSHFGSGDGYDRRRSNFAWMHYGD